jgi:hypothetical protein
MDPTTTLDTRLVAKLLYRSVTSSAEEQETENHLGPDMFGIHCNKLKQYEPYPAIVRLAFTSALYCKRFATVVGGVSNFSIFKSAPMWFFASYSRSALHMG